MLLYMYIAPGQGPGDKCCCQQKALITLPIYCKFENNLYDFKHILNDFIHVYIPGARAEKPLGTSFWCQQKAFITSTICCKFQTNLFEFWFYIHLLMFFHMCIAPGQGQTTLCGQNPDVNRKALSLCPFVASFKKIFIHNFSCFYTCI